MHQPVNVDSRPSEPENPRKLVRSQSCSGVSKEVLTNLQEAQASSTELLNSFEAILLKQNEQAKSDPDEFCLYCSNKLTVTDNVRLGGAAHHNSPPAQLRRPVEGVYSAPCGHRWCGKCSENVRWRRSTCPICLAPLPESYKIGSVRQLLSVQQTGVEHLSKQNSEIISPKTDLERRLGLHILILEQGDLDEDAEASSHHPLKEQTARSSEFQGAAGPSQLSVDLSSPRQTGLQDTVDHQPAAEESPGREKTKVVKKQVKKAKALAVDGADGGSGDCSVCNSEGVSLLLSPCGCAFCADCWSSKVRPKTGSETHTKSCPKCSTPYALEFRKPRVGIRAGLRGRGGRRGESRPARGSKGDFGALVM